MPSTSPIAIACAIAMVSIATTPVQQPATVIVRNGQVVTAERTWQADIAIRDGVIVDIAPKLAFSASTKEIDASGLLVLPGGVDPHVHLGGSGDDYTSGSAA